MNSLSFVIILLCCRILLLTCAFSMRKSLCPSVVFYQLLKHSLASYSRDQCICWRIQNCAQNPAGDQLGGEHPTWSLLVMSELQSGEQEVALQESFEWCSSYSNQTFQTTHSQLESIADSGAHEFVQQHLSLVWPGKYSLVVLIIVYIWQAEPCCFIITFLLIISCLYTLYIHDNILQLSCSRAGAMNPQNYTFQHVYLLYHHFLFSEHLIQPLPAILVLHSGCYFSDIIFSHATGQLSIRDISVERFHVMQLTMCGTK